MSQEVKAKLTAYRLNTASLPEVPSGIQRSLLSKRKDQVSNIIKSFFLAILVSAAIQAVFIICLITVFGDSENVKILTPIWILTGLVSFFYIKKHLDTQS